MTENLVFNNIFNTLFLLQLFIRGHTLLFSSFEICWNVFLWPSMWSVFVKKIPYMLECGIHCWTWVGVLCVTSFLFFTYTSQDYCAVVPLPWQGKEPWAMASVLLGFLTLHAACRKLVHSCHTCRVVEHVPRPWGFFFSAVTGSSASLLKPLKD